MNKQTKKANGRAVTCVKKSPRKTTVKAKNSKATNNPFMDADLIKVNSKSYTIQKVEVTPKGLVVKSRNLASNKKTNQQFKNFKSTYSKKK